jgi:hypothetical protein
MDLVGRYIPECFLEWHERDKMKVQKIVSLDETTMKISQRMNNFSQWVRIGLRNYDRKEDLATETMRRIRWAKAAHMLASTIVEMSEAMDENYRGTVDELITKALNQKTLEEFE